jgi:hypothetical protein
MNTLRKAANLALTLSLSGAAPAFAAGAIYVADPLYCTGKIQKPASYVHKDYYGVSLKLTSALSKKANGGWAQGLETRVGYHQLTEKPDANPSGEVSYGRPLRYSDESQQNLYSDDIHGGELKLQYDGNGGELSPTKEIDLWSGTYQNHIGFYKISCQAAHGEKPSLIIDNTNN